MASPIAWQPWSAATFERAARQGKPLYVNVAAGWCHWCHVMDAETLADPDVVRLLQERFVAIRVDADARPDLAERYQDWGWPANAFLTPDAQPVLELKGYQEVGEFRPLLEKLAKEAKAGKLKGRQPVAAPKRAAGPLEKLRLRVQERLDGFFDEGAAGWGSFQKYPFPGPVEQSFLRARLRGDAAAFERAVRTLRGTLNLVDPAWGGVFQYSVNGGWTEPHYEKIAAVQAGALESFTQAWQWTGDPVWAAAAGKVRDYTLEFLLRPDGAFGASQDADAADLAGEAYYALGDAERRKHGLPRTDLSAYADWNGLLAHALVRHGEATGDSRSLAAAENAVRAVLASHGQGDAVRHGAGADSILHLRDNAAMGRALLALHEATGDEEWLRRAERIGRFLLRNLHSPEGGFLAHTPDPAAVGVFAQPRRPLEENGLAIRFLVDLAHTTPDATLAKRARAAAEEAARALAAPELVGPEAQIIGQFLLGLEWLTLEPVKLVVAGDRPSAAALHAAALRSPTPGRLVRWARPEEGYPARAAIYVCKGNACSPPVTKADALPAAVARMLGT
ncbi:MAG TPA: DUF255 domain-containing protein [Candidatus Thermoplasmatota archaeon]|nr:DUF255 domain-containing protein [Candidatus Thermoplasmatota archaeon]